MTISQPQLARPRIMPYLWFDDNAKEAMEFYVSIFKNSRVIEEIIYENSGPDGNQTVYTCSFELDGQRFSAMSAGPYFKFNEAVSFSINCEDQAEVDYFWEKLSADPESEQCGWVKDKFGLSWQIIPKQLDELANVPDKEQAKRVMHAMLKMKKLIVSELEAAAARK